jgi:hypothetical protein
MRFTALCLVAVALTCGCDGGTRLQGRVLGPDGKPLAGAKVQFGQPGDLQSERVTGEDGRFEVGRVHAPFEVKLVLTVTKEGFRPYRQQISSRRPEEFSGTVVLQPEPAPPKAKE